MRSPLSFALTALVAMPLVPSVVACSKPDTNASPAPAVSAAPAAAPAEKAAPVASVAQGQTLSAGADGVLHGTWKLAKAADPNVSVKLVVGDETIDVGELNATSDDGPSDTSQCWMKNAGGASELACGGTPYINFYTAAVKGGALVVTRTTGVDNQPSETKVVEVLRKPTNATLLAAAGPAPRGLWGNCHAGYVQTKADAPCWRQCLKGNGHRHVQDDRRGGHRRPAPRPYVRPGRQVTASPP